MKINFVDEPTEEEIQFVRQHLREYNKQQLESLDYRQYAAFVTDDAGERIGGIVFFEFGKWVEIEYLWVHPSRRGAGIGGRLLQTALDHAREHGCTHALTNTFSFQALPFYQQFGFRVVFEQTNYPISSSRYFITADL